MKKHIISIFVFLILVALGFCGCTEQEKTDNPATTDDSEKFIGTWLSQSDSSYTYASNGSYYVGNIKLGTWEINEGKLILTYNSGLDFTISYSFSDNNATLTLVSSSGDTTVYIKT